jgi:Type-IV b secretion system, inner-membrane complex component
MAVNAETVKTTEEPEALVIAQSVFYRDRAFWMMGCLILLGILVCLLLQFNLFLRADIAPVPVVFQSTAEGALMAEQPLDVSNQPENALLNWVADLVMAINTFNFVNHDTVIQEGSTFFMPAGYTEYQGALQQFKIVDKVLAGKLVLKAMPLDAPHVVLEKVFAGRYMWKVQIPVQFKYQSVGFSDSDHYQITLIVMRVPASDAPRGMLVLKYAMEEISPM